MEAPPINHTLDPTKRSPTASLLAVLLVYFSTQVALRAQVPNLLDIDEAEQIVLCQRLDWGYGHQPPLYTWLQTGACEVFGPTALALSVLKNLLLLLTYAFTYGAAKALLGDDRRAMLATASIALIPQISWESQRDLTHTVLMTCASAAMMLALAHLLLRPVWWKHVLLGAALGLGMLSKYNFAALAICLLISALCTERGRAALLRPGIALTILIAALIIWPHVRWVIENSHVLRSLAAEIGTQRDVCAAKRIGKLALALASSVVPPMAVLFLLFHESLRRIDASQRLLSVRSYLIASIGLVASIAIIANVPHVKARWIVHLAVVAPMLFFMHVDSNAIRRSQERVLYIVAGTIACAVLIAMAVRTMELRTACGSVNNDGNPFDDLAFEVARRTRFTGGVIVSNEPFFVGNLKHQHPDWHAFIAGVNDDELKRLTRAEFLLVIWDREKSQDIPQELAELASMWTDKPVRRWIVEEFDLSLDRNGAGHTPLGAIVLPPRAGWSEPTTP